VSEYGLRGQDVELPQYTEIVPDRPVFRHLAVHDAKPVRLLNGETFARGRGVPELALVDAAARAAHRDRVPVRGGIRGLRQRPTLTSSRKPTRKHNPCSPSRCGASRNCGGRVTETHIRRGPVIDEILDLAEEIETRLILLGSRGLGP
jgi:hypothetical protein